MVPVHGIQLHTLHHNPPLRIHCPPHLPPRAQRALVLGIQPRPHAAPVERVPALEDGVAAARAEADGACVWGGGEVVEELDFGIDVDDGGGWLGPLGILSSPSTSQRYPHQQPAHPHQHDGRGCACGQFEEHGVERLDAPDGGCGCVEGVG